MKQSRIHLALIPFESQQCIVKTNHVVIGIITEQGYAIYSSVFNQLLEPIERFLNANAQVTYIADTLKYIQDTDFKNIGKRYLAPDMLVGSNVILVLVDDTINVRNGHAFLKYKRKYAPPVATSNVYTYITTPAFGSGLNVLDFLALAPDYESDVDDNLETVWLPFGFLNTINILHFGSGVGLTIGNHKIDYASLDFGTIEKVEVIVDNAGTKEIVELNISADSTPGTLEYKLIGADLLYCVTADSNVPHVLKITSTVGGELFGCYIVDPVYTVAIPEPTDTHQTFLLVASLTATE